MSRDRTVCMIRAKNEQLYLPICLESIWSVAKTIVILDDGSTDDTEAVARKSVFGNGVGAGMRAASFGWIGYSDNRELHFMKSPFSQCVREKERVSEIRDKNLLWSYVKSAIDFDYCLALDGDEALSKKAIENWDATIGHLDAGCDVLTFPFIYLWDSWTMRRVDAIYGDMEDGLPRLRFPRLFTIKRVSEQNLLNMRFVWQGNPGQFHCGSVPMESFLSKTTGGIVGGTIHQPIIHFGYIRDTEDRRRKFEFYNKIDPNNLIEDRYLHIIGEPNKHAPGPVELAEWRDE